MKKDETSQDSSLTPLTPRMSRAALRIEFEAERMMDAREKGSFESWKEAAEERHQEQCDVINENLEAVEAKFASQRAIPNGMGFVAQTGISSFAEQVLNLPFLLPFELERSGIRTTESSVELCRRLGRDILSNSPQSLAIVAALENEQRAEEELMAASVDELKRVATDAGIDMTSFDPNLPLPTKLAPFYFTAREGETYLVAIGKTTLRHQELLEVFGAWQTGENRQDLQLVGRCALKDARFSTFIEARQFATALSDGPDLRNWKHLDGALAMLHAPKTARGKETSLQTRFEPCPPLLGWWSKGGGAAEMSLLETELKNLEFDALLGFYTLLGAVLGSPTLRVTVTVDDLIEGIGRGADARRSKAARQQWREKVWRWLLLFDSLAVIGARPGVWREPRDGESKRKRMDAEQLHSKDALLKIIGQSGTIGDQGTLDNSGIPKEVTVTAGPWIEQWQGNREVLADFGRVRTLAAIPRGKPSGAWAACAGLMLQQRWRERAHEAPVVRAGQTKHLTQQFPAFTRRALLLATWRSDADVQGILNGSDPQRAKTYWEEAVKILKTAGVIGFYAEVAPLEEGYNWQAAWLDQPLDIRPGTELAAPAKEIRASMHKAQKRGQKRP